MPGSVATKFHVPERVDCATKRSGAAAEAGFRWMRARSRQPLTPKPHLVQQSGGSAVALRRGRSSLGRLSSPRFVPPPPFPAARPRGLKAVGLAYQAAVTRLLVAEG